MKPPPLGHKRPASAFAPLANRVFLGIWVGNLLSNVGGWMQTAGAAWEMTSLTSQPIFVALLSAASTLPIFLFCFFAGILADRFDRRRYIIFCQCWMLVVSGIMAVLALLGALTAWNLVAFSFLMGIGNAMNTPAWQAVIPEIVPASQLRPAIALNSAGFNLARTIGPVIGQILLSLVGVFLLFAINSVTYVFVILAMRVWKRPRETPAGQPQESFLAAARTAIAFARGSKEIRAVLTRGACYFVPGIAISTLLPAIGRFALGLDEFSFGLLYTAFGVGAVTGALAMPAVNRLLGSDRANIWAMGLHAAAALVAALVMWPVVFGACFALTGACWMMVVANNNTSMQMILPNFMRARGLAINQVVFFGAMVAGSLLWGKLADLAGVRVALLVSAVSLAPLMLVAASIRLPRSASPRL
ncbi:MAG: MFS transporter [Alphaproteobacteria bacterium]|nr:MFS transporter [Alphaproteobacteria bacterium]